MLCAWHAKAWQPEKGNSFITAHQQAASLCAGSLRDVFFAEVHKQLIKLLMGFPVL